MKVTQTNIKDVLLIEPKVFRDDRGFFYESFNEKIWLEKTDIKVNFVQDNHSSSKRGVLRGLHFQLSPMAQGKLVRCVVGEIFDVAVDIREDSSTFGKWVGEYLSAENKRQLWVPEGFAHGFLALSEKAEILYKATNYYSPMHERCLFWDDKKIGINWPLSVPPILSGKDKEAPLLDAGKLINFDTRS